MATLSPSAVVITNKTAFPLNIALAGIAPLQYANGLEPGESWIMNSPSHSFIFNNLNIPRTLKFIYLCLHFPEKWANRLAHSTTVIEVRFDHGKNRFDCAATIRILASHTLRFLGSLSLLGAMALFLSTRMVRHTRAPTQENAPNVHAVQIHRHSIGLAILGLVLLLCSRFNQCHDLFRRGSSNQHRGLILSVPVATSSLQPSPSHNLSSQSHAPLVSTHSTTVVVGTGTLPPRAHKHFAVSWMLGRFVLWDLDLDQEVLPDANGWRAQTWLS